jgi:hypothetical protein
MFETLDLLTAIGGDLDLVGSALARARAVEAIEDAAEARRAEERRAEAEQRMETMAVLDRQ